MINKIIATSFLFIFSGFALACEIHLPAHLVVLSDHAQLDKTIHHSGCTDETIKEFAGILGSMEGKIPAYQLKRMLKVNNEAINIQPAQIQIQHLSHLIREQMPLPSGIHLKSLSAINTSEVLTLTEGDKIQVECTNCLYGVNQPINVNVTGFDGSQRSLVVEASFRKMVRAYKVQTFHPAFSEISSSSLTEELVEAIPHTDLVTDLSTLKFFKVNKPIKAGSLLRRSDLNALNLVKAGLKTEVIIENSLLKLKTHGVSRGNGSLGDFVEVFHPQKNKKYLGKVIDINKVLVEL